MPLRPITSVLFAGLVVLPAVVLVQYWRHRLHRWRLALATSAELMLLSNVVLALTGDGLIPSSTPWLALALVSAVGSMGGFAFSAWLWLRRDRAPTGAVAGCA